MKILYTVDVLVIKILYIFGQLALLSVAIGYAYSSSAFIDLTLTEQFIFFGLGVPCIIALLTSSWLYFFPRTTTAAAIQLAELVLPFIALIAVQQSISVSCYYIVATELMSITLALCIFPIFLFFSPHQRLAYQHFGRIGKTILWLSWILFVVLLGFCAVTIAMPLWLATWPSLLIIAGTAVINTITLIQTIFHTPQKNFISEHRSQFESPWYRYIIAVLLCTTAILLMAIGLWINN